ncbi:MAG: carboxypeptidase-like regulatory domain-containing protein [Prolixibacteraceae bacterium]
MKKITFIILALVLTVSAFAKAEKTNPETNTASEPVLTTELSGLVIDKISNEVLVGVEVSIEGTNLKTYTDFDGQFAFKDLRPGKYKLVSSYISYNMEVTEVADAKDKTLKIELEAAK